MGAQWKAKGKELAANAKGKVFGKLAKEIMVAARSGADPATNSRLRLVVEQARKVSMPKDTLERAIKKGAGLSGEAVHFEHVMYEGFAPHQVPVMVECLTDNLNRTASEVRVLFRKGQQGTPGSASWDLETLHAASTAMRSLALSLGSAPPRAAIMMSLASLPKSLPLALAAMSLCLAFHCAPMAMLLDVVALRGAVWMCRDEGLCCP